MIGFLKGSIDYRDDPYLFVNVSGVGYKVYASGPLLASVHVNDATTVFTYTHVREDLLELYGFLSREDEHLFEYLLGISGIGPKTAIGVFTLGPRGKIITAIQTADVDFFSGVPRLGKKNAQKIIIELKNKIGGIAELDLKGESPENEDVLEALKSMGFSGKEAHDAIREVTGEATTISDKVRLALKYLGK